MAATIEAPYTPFEGNGGAESGRRRWPQLCALGVVALLASGAAVAAVAAAAPITTVAAAKKQLLLVIDMQKDYDDASNLLLYGYIRSPIHGNVSGIIPAVNKVRNSRAWDLVVFSIDWLDVAELRPSQQSTPFCIASTPGAELVDGLEVNSSDLVFTKNRDDVFNEDDHRPDGPRNFIRGYGLLGEGSRIGATSNRLVDVLAKMGFHAADTTITVVGIFTDICVLKSALHARALGFEVRLLRRATCTPNTGPPINWSLPAPREIANAVRDWQRAVYSSGNDGCCGEHWAHGYMELAGIEVVQ